MRRHICSIAMLRSAAAVLGLAAIAAPGAMAGEFFTGTRSDSSRFESTRTSVGAEKLTARRDFTNSINGSSHKHFVNVSASAENARIGQRSYSFIEGELAIDADAQGVGGGSFGGGAGIGWSGVGGGFGGGGDVATAAQAGAEIDGQTGWGSEMYLDGSLNASAEWGGARTNFSLSEWGGSKYEMKADFAEIRNEDGTSSEGGSVFSFN